MKKFDKSIAAFEEAQDLMPGGVNSPVRAFKSVVDESVVYGAWKRL